MSTESSEFAVPEVVAAEEKEVTKEIKGTKRPAEVSRYFYPPTSETKKNSAILMIWIKKKCDRINDAGRYERGCITKARRFNQLITTVVVSFENVYMSVLYGTR